ncbi:unnamed protein product [Brachionus calyciflorus]|uniref:Uncharacterized protein n=2 Tax=Brachionus calyciflorus TaxID=104777 RepID=A0A814C650_9BILA|nr:unnamed protein product [Brachionus calyciflorus]
MSIIYSRGQNQSCYDENEQGKSFAAIGRELNRTKSCIKRIVDWYNETNSYQDRPKSERPRISTLKINGKQINGNYRIERPPVLLVAVLAASVTSKAILKNEIAEIDPKLFQFAVDFYNQLIAEPINTLASALASMSVHLFAGIATEGISGFGKRELVQDNKFLGDLWDSLSGSLFEGANSLVTNLATSLTQWLVNFALGGNNKGFWSDLGGSLLGGLTDVGNQVAQVTGIFLTQLLLSIGNNNKGLTDLFSNVTSTLGGALDSAVQAAAFQIAVWLLNVTENGLLPTIGKRSLTN